MNFKNKWRRLVMYSLVLLFVALLISLLCFKLIELKDFLTFILSVVGLTVTAEYVYITQKMNIKRSLQKKASDEIIASLAALQTSLNDLLRLTYFEFDFILEDEDDAFNWSKQISKHRIAVTMAYKQVYENAEQLNEVVEANRMALSPLMLMIRYVVLKFNKLRDSMSDTDKKIRKEHLIEWPSDEDVKAVHKIYKSMASSISVLLFHTNDLQREVINTFQADIFNNKLPLRTGIKGNDKKTLPISQLATARSVYDLAYEDAKSRGWNEQESIQQAEKLSKI